MIVWRSSFFFCCFTAWSHYHQCTSYFLFKALLVASFWTNIIDFWGTRFWVNIEHFRAFRIFFMHHNFPSSFQIWANGLDCSMHVLQLLKMMELGAPCFLPDAGQTFLLRDTASMVLMRAGCVICDAGIHPLAMMTSPSACFILAISRENSFFK